MSEKISKAITNEEYDETLKKELALKLEVTAHRTEGGLVMTGPIESNELTNFELAAILYQTIVNIVGTHNKATKVIQKMALVNAKSCTEEIFDGSKKDEPIQ